MLNFLYCLLLLITKKAKGIYTARPRTIKISGGEIIFKNLPKEMVEEIIAKITGIEPKVQTQVVEAEEPSLVASETTTPVVVSMSQDLICLALGLHQDEKGKWEMAEVKYNPATKEAVVETVKFCDTRDIAIGDFRVLAARRLFKG